MRGVKKFNPLFFYGENLPRIKTRKA